MFCFCCFVVFVGVVVVFVLFVGCFMIVYFELVDDVNDFVCVLVLVLLLDNVVGFDCVWMDVQVIGVWGDLIVVFCCGVEFFVLFVFVCMMFGGVDWFVLEQEEERQCLVMYGCDFVVEVNICCGEQIDFQLIVDLILKSIQGGFVFVIVKCIDCVEFFVS